MPSGFTKVFITGASGRLGRAVLAKLKGATPIVRRPCGLENEVVSDFSESDLRKALGGAKAVVHLAGSVDTLDPAGMRESNVGLTRRLVAAAPEGCRFVFASSISVYGKALKENPANEDTPTNPDSAYSKSKLDAERIVESRKNHVILRIGTLYGPAFEDYYRVLGLVEKREARIIGDGSNRIPFVHVDDAAAAICAALEKGGGRYVIAGRPLSQNEVYRIAAHALGVAPPDKSVPRALALAMAWLSEARFRLGGRRPGLTGEHVSILSYDRPFDCRKAERDLGFAPRSLEEGIRAMAQEYRAGRADKA